MPPLRFRYAMFVTPSHFRQAVRLFSITLDYAFAAADAIIAFYDFRCLSAYCH